MTLRSMTGFGRGEHACGRRQWVAEIRSVNHRFLDVKIRLPRTLGQLEEAVKKLLSGSFTRGRVELCCECRFVTTASAPLTVDRERARQYHDGLTVLQQELRLPGEIDLTALLACGDLFPIEDETFDPDTAWQEMLPSLAAAVRQCLEMRTAEGVRLVRDLEKHLSFFQEHLARLTAVLPDILAAKKQRLLERLEELTGAVSIDPQRLAQEVAILVDKSDVSEELARLQSHISQFCNYLDQGEPAGRRLDFLLQEFSRETNTMAAKINNVAAGHLLVEMKNILEKMREQVQNLE